MFGKYRFSKEYLKLNHENTHHLHDNSAKIKYLYLIMKQHQANII